MSKVTRAALVDAAKEINDVLDLDPSIDVTLGVKEIREQMVVAVSFLRDDDKVSDGTRNIVAALTGDGQDESAEMDGSDDVAGEAQCEDANEVETSPAPVSTKKAKAVKAPKAPKEQKVAKEKVKKVRESSRATGKLPKSRDDFRPLREGTIRGNIFARMDGKSTVEQIAVDLKLDRANTHSHIYCLWRDCGIGFRFDDERRVTGMLPMGVSSAFRVQEAA